MNRRQLLALTAVPVTASVAGCADEVVREIRNPAVDETFSGEQIFPFEAESGDPVEVELEVDSGMGALALIISDAGEMGEISTSTETSRNFTANHTGTYRAICSTGRTGRARISVFVDPWI